MTTSSIVSASSPFRRSGLSPVAKAARTLHPQFLLVGYIFVIAFCVRLLATALGVGGALLLVAAAHLGIGIWGARLKAALMRDKRTEVPVIQASDDPVVVPEAIESRVARTRPLPMAAPRTTPLGPTAGFQRTSAAAPRTIRCNACLASVSLPVSGVDAYHVAARAPRSSVAATKWAKRSGAAIRRR